MAALLLASRLVLSSTELVNIKGIISGYISYVKKNVLHVGHTVSIPSVLCSLICLMCNLQHGSL
jgi:hypothetical protein